VVLYLLPQEEAEVAGREEPEDREEEAVVEVLRCFSSNKSQPTIR